MEMEEEMERMKEKLRTETAWRASHEDHIENLKEEVEKMKEQVEGGQVERPMRPSSREMSVQVDLLAHPQVPRHQNSSPAFRDAPSPAPPIPTRGSTPGAYSMYSQRTSPDSFYPNTSPRASVHSFPQPGYWQHRRSHTPSSVPDELMGAMVSPTPDIETDLVISPEDLAPPFHAGAHHPMYHPPQPRAAPRAPHPEPGFLMPDAETQNAAAVLIQKAFRSKAARRASHVAHRLRRKAQRRAGAEARKTVEPHEMGADYSLIGVGRNLKWAFTGTGATISSLKGNDVSEMSIGDHLVAVNDVTVDGMTKEDIKIVWKREHGASEYTTLYFRRALQNQVSSPMPMGAQ
jgi:hypothetical protein